MNYLYQVKEEYPGSGSGASRPTGSGEPPSPQPMEGLHDAGPPAFLTKTYDMVDDKTTNRIVSWSGEFGTSFVVWDPHSFSLNLLPRYFKHNNFSSFVRQLNTYGFRKIDPDRWEFANEGFVRGQRHILKSIRRRRTPNCSQQQALWRCVEVGRFGVDAEVDRLRRDKQVLMMELVKLRQHQHNTRAYLHAVELRLRGSELRQHHMMAFLARAVHNPAFLHQLAHHEEITKKRRRPIDQAQPGPVKLEPDLDDFGYCVSELEALALEMQRGRDKELDDGFWEELFGESVRNDSDDEDVDVLADRLGYLGGSLSPK